MNFRHCQTCGTDLIPSEMPSGYCGMCRRPRLVHWMFWVDRILIEEWASFGEPVYVEA